MNYKDLLNNTFFFFFFVWRKNMQELQTLVTAGTLNPAKLFYSRKLNQAAEQFWQKYETFL